MNAFPCQLVLAVSAADNELAQRFQFFADDRRIKRSAVFLYQAAGQLVYISLTQGPCLWRGLLELPFPVLYPAFQPLVLLPKSVKLREVLGEARALHAVDLCKAVRVVAGLILQHTHTGPLKASTQFLAAIVRYNSGQNLVEADGALGLCLEVAGWDLCGMV